MEIVKLGAPRLREKALPVRVIDTRYGKLAGAMLETLQDSRGVGLAGPQVSVMERIFVLLLDGDIPRVFINPSILETSETTASAEEGCLSIPGVWADVCRAKRVKVQAWNERGRPFTLEAEGILARAILHEYDHLEGTLFIDRLPPLKRERVLAKYAKSTKTKH